ncbi:uncharacterized protein LOC121978147 [Zingiber officinale]|uniref:uncharacterized protein LOC121978147 n=1 Tax=Zingiber officinale TaxID=94328 RepID=UPI001C4D5CBE|nr:uncharacterized protein LOC121978147 [Zingiber officinale]
MEEEKAREYQDLVKLFSKVEVNVPLLTMIKQILKYAKFLKDLCVHKNKLKINELISMGKNVSALLQLVPQKCEDPGVFTVPCVIGDCIFEDAMLDLGASINVMPKSIFQLLRIGPLQPTGVVIHLANRSQAHPAGVIEDVLVKVRELIFPADFYVLDMEGDVLANRSPLIVGRPFLKIARTKIDVHAGTLSMEIGDTVVWFSIFEAMKHPREDHSIFSLDISEELDGMDFLSDIDEEVDITDVDQGEEFVSLLEDVVDMGAYVSLELCVGDYIGEALPLESPREEELCVGDYLGEALPLGLPSVDQTQNELKSLPQHLKYAYLGENQQLPVIIAQNLKPDQEERLLEILRQHRKAIGWTLADIPRISPSICMHRIYLEEDVKLMLERLAGKSHYCFLDGYTGYFHICIDPEDQEKTTFTCPFGTFAYRRMPFGLCNAPEHDIVLGHIVSRKGIEVDPAKVSAISSLSYLACVRDVRAFLGHARFYRRFIRDFSKIALPLSQLLQKDVMFHFDQRCIEAFDRLKEALTSTPIIRPPDWSLPFELMCDASDFVVGAVLAQRVDRAPYVICYASKTLDSAQANYTTTEKELLSIIFALDKFRSYLLCSHVVVFSDHVALKYLLKKPDVKPRSEKENLVADHLSRIEGDLDRTAIDDDFSDEQLL